MEPPAASAPNHQSAMNTTEHNAYTVALATIKTAIQSLTACKVSVSTDYAVGCAIAHLESAHADLQHAYMCSSPEERRVTRLKLPGRPHKDQNCIIE